MEWLDCQAVCQDVLGMAKLISRSQLVVKIQRFKNTVITRPVSLEYLDVLEWSWNGFEYETA